MAKPKEPKEAVVSPVVETSPQGVAVFEEGQHPRAVRKAVEVKAAEEAAVAATEKTAEETPAEETLEE